MTIEKNIDGYQTFTNDISNDEVIVENIEFFGDQVPIDSNDRSNSSLTLLNDAVTFTIADAMADLTVHPKYMADDMKAFGLEGKQAILDFKAKFLGPQGALGLPAYKLAKPFEVDVNKRMVSLGFECLIQGYEGLGTDYVYFNDQNLIRDLVVVRHSGSYQK